MEHHEKPPTPKDPRHKPKPAEDAEERAKALRDELVEKDKPRKLPEDDRPGYPDPDDTNPNPESPPPER